MRLMNREYLRQSIKRRDSGQVEWTGGLFFLLILAIMMHTQLQLEMWKSTSVYMEDALAASNLASALIDIEEYGKTNKILIRDEQRAYEIYKESLKINLGLNEQWVCENLNLISGPVEIVDYIIYNVDGNAVETVQIGSDGQVLEQKIGIKGKVQAPDGSMVENTGIYSALSFEVKGFPNMLIRAEKGKLVDIVSEKGEKNENEQETGLVQSVDR